MKAIQILKSLLSSPTTSDEDEQAIHKALEELEALNNTIESLNKKANTTLNFYENDSQLDESYVQGLSEAYEDAYFMLTKIGDSQCK